MTCKCAILNVYNYKFVQPSIVKQTRLYQLNTILQLAIDWTKKENVDKCFCNAIDKPEIINNEIINNEITNEIERNGFVEIATNPTAKYKYNGHNCRYKKTTNSSW